MPKKPQPKPDPLTELMNNMQDQLSAYAVEVVGDLQHAIETHIEDAIADAKRDAGANFAERLNDLNTMDATDEIITFIRTLEPRKVVLLRQLCNESKP